MAVRNLTEIFILMRNNAVRSRHIYSEQDSNEQMALVELYDAEEGRRFNDRVPPPWLDHLEDAQMVLKKLKVKINELKNLHSQNLHKSTFDESTDSEVAIENCSHEISSLFNSVHRTIQYIKSHSNEGTSEEKILTLNVIKTLATSLQELSLQFRATQNSYLKQLNSREERSKTFFENSLPHQDFEMISNDIDEDFVNSSKQMTQQQLLYLEEENYQVSLQREQEVNTIVKSIVELNEIFKDLSQMVLDQGTILDRIDYNIEQTHVQVQEGFKQLQKADAYQRKNRKMCCIIGLASTVILLFFILIIVKT